MIDDESYDRMMAVYENRDGEGVVFQPRIKHWYDVNLAAGTLPEKYIGMYLDEIYDNLDVTPREVWGLSSQGSASTGYLSLQIKEGDGIEVWVKQTHGFFYENKPRNYIVTKYKTPIGAIRQIQRRTEYGTSLYNTEYYLKDLKDIEVYKYILQERKYLWNRLQYEWGLKRFGNILPLRVALPRSPLMWLIVSTMGFKRTVTMLWKHRREMEELMLMLEDEFYKMLKVCRNQSIVEISFGDNMHQDLCSPPLFKKYIIPFYQRVIPKVHAMGMYATSHWDGFVKQLLPLVKETHLDGLECVTPLPQGDVTLEEMQSGMGGMFLRDGIPAILMGPWSNLITLKNHVQTLLKMFYPRIILGISYLLPSNADIERISIVNKICKEFNETL
ncbi:MAG: hypothetical protein JSV20_07445 [Candidatus Bathyarchaeota archaeon]|nr:MAG: hypothetical protein JSV20_07445 [Candidatus Bathyarchaeota archaeon]